MSPCRSKVQGGAPGVGGRGHEDQGLEAALREEASHRLRLVPGVAHGAHGDELARDAKGAHEGARGLGCRSARAGASR